MLDLTIGEASLLKTLIKNDDDYRGPRRAHKERLLTKLDGLLCRIPIHRMGFQVAWVNLMNPPRVFIEVNKQGHFEGTIELTKDEQSFTLNVDQDENTSALGAVCDQMTFRVEPEVGNILGNWLRGK